MYTHYPSLVPARKNRFFSIFLFGSENMWSYILLGPKFDADPDSELRSTLWIIIFRKTGGFRRIHAPSVTSTSTEKSIFSIFLFEREKMWNYILLSPKFDADYDSELHFTLWIIICFVKQADFVVYMHHQSLAPARKNRFF